MRRTKRSRIDALSAQKCSLLSCFLLWVPSPRPSSTVELADERWRVKKADEKEELSLLDNSGVNHQWREAEFSAMARVTRLGLRRRAFCHLGSNSAGNELQSTGCIQIQMDKFMDVTLYFLSVIFAQCLSDPILFSEWSPALSVLSTPSDFFGEIRIPLVKKIWWWRDLLQKTNVLLVS